jgi:GNAT-family acetyltransferase (TIGR03103 family)
VNIYAQILIDEAKRRGIRVKVIDKATGMFVLEHNGKRIRCRESLTDRTSAVAMTICENKALTRRLLKREGFSVPEQVVLSRDANPEEIRSAAETQLKKWGSAVVKPLRGEQGAGITVDVSTPGEVERAFRFAAENGDEVVLEQYVKGRDLRIIVIDYAFVAAIERTPARVTGDGRHTVRQLAEKANRKLREQTGGEARIPLDEETRRVVRQAGFDWDAVPPAGKTVPLRKTANFHTGGTIRDVTDQVPPRLRRIAEEASRILDIPVVGFDFIVPDYTGERYVIIEANERPGLANHEPQPTAERFIDFLFPETKEEAKERAG